MYAIPSCENDSDAATTFRWSTNAYKSVYISFYPIENVFNDHVNKRLSNARNV